MSRFISVDGLKVHFKHTGKGTPVVLLHGGGNDWHEWAENLDALAQVSEVFALDFPGFGLSDAPQDPIHPSWMISFIKEFTDAVGLKKISLVGQSLGGMISAAFALEYPERVKKLVLVDSAGLGKVSWKGSIIFQFFVALDHLSGRQRGPRYLPGTAPELPVVGR